MHIVMAAPSEEENECSALNKTYIAPSLRLRGHYRIGTEKNINARSQGEGTGNPTSWV